MNNFPISRDQRLPTVPNYPEAAERDKVEKQRQAMNYNQRHAAKELPVLLLGSSVYVPDRRVPGKLYQPATRSYLLQTDEGMYRRNCRHLIEIPRSGTEVATTICTKSSDGANTETEPNTTDLYKTYTNPYPTCLTTGKILKPPEGLDNSWNNSEKGICGDK